MNKHLLLLVGVLAMLATGHVLVEQVRPDALPHPEASESDDGQHGDGETHAQADDDDDDGGGTPLAGTATKPQTTTKGNPEGSELSEKVGPGVIEALQREGAVNVVIMLEEPPSMHARRIDLPTLKSEIAGLQDEVLSSLGSSEFQVKLRYQTIPAFAGGMLSETGLAKLIANPTVVRIDLDVGGSGSSGNR